MPITKHSSLEIHPPRAWGDHEAGPISGNRGIGIVQRFGVEINLTETDGVHWRSRRLSAKERVVNSTFYLLPHFSCRSAREQSPELFFHTSR
jgi:hypothetical protein